MLSLLTALCFAGAPVLADPLPSYPALLPPRGLPRWERADINGQRLGLVGGGLAIGSGAATAVAAGLMLLSNDAGPAVGATGSVIFIGVGPGLAFGPAIELAGAMRSARSLRKRGVRVSQLPGAIGWLLYGSIPILAGIPNDDEACAIGAYVGAVGMGYVQMRANQRQRTRLGLPSTRQPVVVIE